MRMCFTRTKIILSNFLAELNIAYLPIQPTVFRLFQHYEPEIQVCFSFSFCKIPNCIVIRATKTDDRYFRNLKELTWFEQH